MNVSPSRDPRRLSGLALALVLASSACAAPATSAPAPQTGAAARPVADPSSSPSAATVATSEEPIPEPPKTGGPMTTRRGVGWVVFAVGASAAAVAVATSFMMLHENSVRDGECDAQKRCSDAGIQANARLGSLGGWNAGAWVLGAAGLGVGAFLVVTGSPDGARRTAIGVSPSASGIDLNLRSTF